MMGSLFAIGFVALIAALLLYFTRDDPDAVD